MTLTITSVAVIVLSMQLLTGIVSGLAMKAVLRTAWDRDSDGAVAEPLAATSLERGRTLDVLSIAFVLFVFWGYVAGRLAWRETLLPFVLVLIGTGLKEVFQVWLPSRAR